MAKHKPEEATPDEGPDRGESRAVLNISGVTVKSALTRMRAAKKDPYTEEQADQLWWFFAYAKRRGFSLSEATHELGLQANSTLWRLWNGSYTAKPDGVLDKIRRYRRIAEERETYGGIDFVETSIATRIFKACDVALMSQTIVSIYGDPQIGKTWALEEYCRRNNHGQTKYIRMPASAGVQLFMREVARACFVSANGSFEGMREAVMNVVDSRTNLLFDEVHQGFLSYQKSSQVKVFEVMREIYDRTKCGMVLCGTNVFKTEIQTGKLSQMLEQLRRRCTLVIQLPNRPPKHDLDKIAAAFHLSPPTDDALEIVRDLIHKSGLGMYVKYLRSASRIAKKQQSRLSWKHVEEVRDILAKLGREEVQ